MRKVHLDTVLRAILRKSPVDTDQKVRILEAIAKEIGFATAWYTGFEEVQPAIQRGRRAGRDAGEAYPKNGNSDRSK